MREPALYAYLDARCGPVPEYLHTVERNTHLHVLKPQMITGRMQGRFLVWLVSWLRAAVRDRPFRVLEVGTFTAYGALCLAERLHAGDEVHTIEINDELEPRIRTHLELAGFGASRTPETPSIHLHIGDANALIPTLPGHWDLVYLDAKKDDYPAQFAMVEGRLAPGGIVLLDNTLWDGQVLDEREQRATTVLLREFTLVLAQDPRWETLMLPMSDGLLMVRGKD